MTAYHLCHLIPMTLSVFAASLLAHQALFVFAAVGHALLRCTVVSDSLWSHVLWPVRLLCPWDSFGKNTRVGCRFLLQGIFMPQGLNPRLLLGKQILLPLHHLGSLPAVIRKLLCAKPSENKIERLLEEFIIWKVTKHTDNYHPLRQTPCHGSGEAGGKAS